jgi:hypothetical protein
MVLEQIAGTMPWVCGIALPLAGTTPALSPVIVSAPSWVRACCTVRRNFLPMVHLLINGATISHYWPDTGWHSI